MENKMTRTTCNESGFSLVELAVVIIIIGLLIGGVLKGQQLIEGTKVTATITEIKNIQAAYKAFKSAYGLPAGDLPDATVRLANCSAGATSCEDGNGDGIIGGAGVGAAAGSGIVNFWEGDNFAIGDENTQFWKHLSLAGMITGVQANADLVAWGESHPASSIRGGYTIAQTRCAVDGAVGGATCNASPEGLTLRLQNCLDTCPGNNIEMGIGRAPMSPKQAEMIDAKMDDGIPNMGKVRSMGPGNGGVVDQCEVEYNGGESKDCTMGFITPR